ncbi:MAG TPA: hypothetical protein PLY70_08895 [Saprospiraceae bacterium]|nr:hypothetical protein [Saprospiraceae bacterium]HPN68362.1 hypothetical protein [Saprospiraceae bacterium]
METKMLILALLTSFLPSCRNTITCNEIYNSKDQFLYIDGIENECTYKLGSRIYQEDLKAKVKFDKNILLFQSSESSSLDTFLVLSKEIPNQLYELHFEFQNKNITIETSSNSLSVQLIRIIDDTYIMKISDVLNLFNTSELKLNAIVFFEEKKGFIGSYLENPSEQNWIIQKAGNILETKIDYSAKNFGVLR